MGNVLQVLLSPTVAILLPTDGVRIFGMTISVYLTYTMGQLIVLAALWATTLS